MNKGLPRLIAALAICLLVLLLTACRQSVPESGPLPGTEPVPTQPDTPPVPTVAPPSAQPTGPAYAADPDPVPTPLPAPSLPPDEDASLSYFVGEDYVTVPALLHHSLLGYAITYDPALFSCSSYQDVDSYWNSEGNYLAFSLIRGFAINEVLDGLRLQDNIYMEPELVSLGKGNTPAYTLYLTAPNGLYRQYWVLRAGDNVLLAELSYDTVDDNAALIRSAQLAALDSLFPLY